MMATRGAATAAVMLFQPSLDLLQKLLDLCLPGLVLLQRIVLNVFDGFINHDISFAVLTLLGRTVPGKSSEYSCGNMSVNAILIERCIEPELRCPSQHNQKQAQGIHHAA